MKDEDFTARVEANGDAGRTSAAVRYPQHCSMLPKSAIVRAAGAEVLHNRNSPRKTDLAGVRVTAQIERNARGGRCIAQLG